MKELMQEIQKRGFSPDVWGGINKKYKKEEFTQMGAVNYYEIDEAAARRAQEMNSFSEYEPGSATAGYRAMVDKAAKIAAEQKARVDPLYHEKIDRLLDAYARKLARNLNDGYAIEARVPSVLIAGPANFPTKKKEKQNAARDRNMREWQEIQGLLGRIKSTGKGGISADDPCVKEKLAEKLDRLTETQETMKLVNAYYRSHSTLDGCPFLTQEEMKKLKSDMASGWHHGNAPYMPWQLTNNGAEIRRIRKRLAEADQKDQTAYAGWEFDGGRVEPDREDNRLRVFFEEKPDEDTRSALKGNGFKWSPKAGAWQRQLNGNAYHAAGRIARIQPLTGENPADLLRKAGSVEG